MKKFVILLSVLVLCIIAIFGTSCGKEKEKPLYTKTYCANSSHCTYGVESTIRDFEHGCENVEIVESITVEYATGSQPHHHYIITYRYK